MRYPVVEVIDPARPSTKRRFLTTSSDCARMMPVDTDTNGEKTHLPYQPLDLSM
jgi:hypothetical protein